MNHGMFELNVERWTPARDSSEVGIRRFLSMPEDPAQGPNTPPEPPTPPKPVPPPEPLPPNPLPIPPVGR
ncbi:MAG: hypothetical protein WAN04_05055 [Candidatus Udaeobacter sp.]